MNYQMLMSHQRSVIHQKIIHLLVIIMQTTSDAHLKINRKQNQEKERGHMNHQVMILLIE